MSSAIFFFNDTATTEIYTLSLHDALPILERAAVGAPLELEEVAHLGLLHLLVRLARDVRGGARGDRKSTRLNSSHANISYAVFCLKNKKSPRNCSCLKSYFATISHPLFSL